MKKYFIPLAVLMVILFSIPLMGQTWIGATGGFNLTNLAGVSTEEGEDLKTRTCFSAGGVLSIVLSEMFAVQFEPAYVQKGNKVEFDGEEFGTIKVDYFEFPILLKVSFGEFNVFRPYILAGPYIGSLLSSELDPKEGDSEDLKDETKDSDAGLNFGAGLSIPLGSSELFVEALYGLGLTNISEEEDGDSIKNRVIQVKFGIALPLGSR